MASPYSSMSPHKSSHLTNEIFRTVKQNFVLPEIQPYEPCRVWKRRDCEMVVERPEDYWRSHYLRRNNNTHRGFYSNIREPYKCMGGDVVLDTYDLVYNNLNCVDQKNIAESRKEVEVKHEVYNPLIRTEAEELTGDNKNIRGGGRAGYRRILEALKLTAERRAAVNAGLPYEEHLRIVESRAAELDVKPVESMTLMSTTDMIIQSAFNKDANDSGTSSLAGTSDHSNSSIIQRIKSGSSRIRSRASSISDSSKTTTSDSESTSSLLCSTLADRVARLRKDNVEYLMSILEILIILHNMKSRFLKSKIPLPPPIMRSLKRPDGQRSKGLHSNKLRPNSKYRSTSTLLSTEYSNFMLNDNKGLESPSALPRRIITTAQPNFGIFSARRFSRVPALEEHRMETWDDLIALDNREKLNVHQADAAKGLHITTDMASRTLRWSRVAKDVEEKTKAPMWQVILTEKTTGESFQDRKPKSTDVALVPQRARADWEQAKAQLERNCISDIEQLERQTVQYFKYKMGCFDEMTPGLSFERYCAHMRDTSGLIPIAAKNNEIMEALEVPPCKWFEELQMKMFHVMGSEEQEINTALLKLGKYSQMGPKSIHHCRAKLCLAVMSMPAYDICKIAMQKALKFVLKNILNGEADELYFWLDLRKIPVVLIK